MYKQAEIEQWGIDRDLYKESNFEAQFDKLLEEFTELYSAIRTSNIDEIKDAIGDNYVVLIHLAKLAGKRIDNIQFVSEHPPARDDRKPVFIVATHLAKAYARLFHKRTVTSIVSAIRILIVISRQSGVSFEECVDGAVKEIGKRTGRFINGVYVKDQK